MIPGVQVAKQRLIRYGGPKAEFLFSKLKELTDLHCIEPAQSDRACNTVLAAQKGTFRCCMNFGPLNAASENVTYPIPNLNDQSRFLRGKRVFSVLDNKLGYHQLLVHPACRHLFAFQTQFGIYQWIRCPFGHKNLPAWYNFLMINIVLVGLIYTILVVYFDDSVIGSNSHEEHLQHLRIVLTRFKDKRMVLRGSKCQLGRTQVKFHGHIFSGSTVRHDPERLQRVFEIPRPTTRRKMEAFLGLSNYFAHFIPNYSMLRKPLNALLAFKTFTYDNRLYHAFEMLKQAINGIRHLYHIDYDNPIYLAVDASLHGIGGYLYQISTSHLDNATLAALNISSSTPVHLLDHHNPILHQPIGFISHNFREQQLKWSNVVREAYAISYAILAFAFYLDGAFFTVLTDHRNFLSMFTSTHPVVTHAFLKIQHFNFVLAHIKGTDNTCPDILSRLHITNITQPTLHPTFVTQDHHLIPDDLPQPQPQQPVVTMRPISPHQITEENLQILKRVHNNAGHHGVTRTLAKLHSLGYNWPSMRRDLVAFITTCPQCQLTWRIPRAHSIIRRTFESYDPFYAIAMDYIGPFTMDKLGYQYYLVVIDIFSRYVLIYPQKEKSTE